jgi:hypothetical protein
MNDRLERIKPNIPLSVEPIPIFGIAHMRPGSEISLESRKRTPTKDKGEGGGES